jgi:hypothetical protein
MSQWTDAARQTFERYCTRARQSLAGSGADAEEVVDDLRRHVDEEIRLANLSIVTEEDMQRILNRVGELKSDSKSELPPKAQNSSSKNEPQQEGRRRPGWLLLVLGVIMPTITIGFELVTGISAGVLFDPLPTWFHVFAAALVPVVNLWMWRAGRDQNPKHARLLGRFNGFALGVCLYYAVLYLPFAPFAAIGVIYFGLGLIPLAPYFALLATPMIRRRYRERVGIARLPGIFVGPVIAIGLLVTVQLPTMLTYYGLAKAGSDEPAISRSGVRLLRNFGNREMMLRACYGMLRTEADLDFMRDIASGGHIPSSEQAQQIFYRVTGQPFNSTPPPSYYTRAGRWTLLEDEFDWSWDAALGGEAVAGRVKGLSLQSSRLDTIVEPDAAVSYTEWTLEFKNISVRQREARAQIQLPPGGVVSRLTLWVNGEEREAAFAGRAEVREAYQKVAVVQRHDPVLVTTCGPDRVLVQCFPVPANGGTMKVRVGITAPLALESLEQGRFAWPKFLERNFGISGELKHSLWIESPTQLKTENTTLKNEHPKENVFALHGSLGEKDFAEANTSVVVNRPPDVTSAWTPASDANFIVRQTIRETTRSPPSRVVFLIDGSTGMKEYAATIADILAKLPDTLEAIVVVAGDQPMAFAEKQQKLTEESRKEIQDWLKSLRFAGGCDNLPALEKAWDLVSGHNDGLVVWIHAPQPFLLSGTESLRQRLERGSQSVRFIGFQTSQGPNRIAEKLDGLPQVVFAPRFGTVESDLTKLIETLAGKAKQYELVRERIAQPGDIGATKQASRHIERLWARDEAARLVSVRKRDEAAKLAAKNQLVTPVSGAVVLETARQYAENNLKPADPTTVPIIPEPGTSALLLVGLGAFLLRKFSSSNRRQTD